MHFFITEAERKQKHTTCCFEFQRGAFHNIFWRDDSICLHANIFDDHKLYDLFHKAIPQFDYYGITEVTKENWQTLQVLAHECGGTKEAIILELAQWVRDCFQNENVFTICGI